MELKIYKNETNKIIYTNNNINELLELYNINKNSEEFQELFETEILFDIFEENNINSSNVYYEIK
jgi:predicted translin family RNA/ssDNA-binding protein